MKQIIGHLIDSASNNLHRAIHLQYQPSPVLFPDYANLGANDTWVALQRYQEEEWQQIVQLWKFSNLHLAHVIGHISTEALSNVWVSALGERITLLEMMVDYPRHLWLHLGDIEALMADNSCVANQPQALSPAVVDQRQVLYYQDKLSYEIDAWDLAELRRRDPSVVVVDARSAQAFGVEHIAGAVNLPHCHMNAAAARDLDPGKTYVIYCDGIGCNASTKGAQKLAELGFVVKELIGGLEWWKREGYPTEGSAMVQRPLAGCGCD
jgi:rhodanese-related sulfurtransferase